MIVALVAGLLVANSPLAPIYRFIHHVPIHAGIATWEIDRPLISWINDGLMVLFFVHVGLEVKRQFLVGDLSDPRHAALPAMAAVGGVVAPAIIFLTIAGANPVWRNGWAVPTATDIVLSIGLLSLLSHRVPTGLRILLTAVAIFDDVAAVIVIGVFYGEQLAPLPLAVAGAMLVVLVVLNVSEATRPGPYILVGVVLWIAMLDSGIEPALAGVIIAAGIPLGISGNPGPSPLQSTERLLQPWVTLFIVPVFAFFNAGIALTGSIVDTVASPVSLGIMLGLVFGKPLGVMAAAWLATRLRIAALPDDVDWGWFFGAALLAGVGFTMSLFVATLAFTEPQVLESARMAVLLGSSVSAAAGLTWLTYRSRHGHLENWAGTAGGEPWGQHSPFRDRCLFGKSEARKITVRLRRGGRWER